MSIISKLSIITLSVLLILSFQHVYAEDKKAKETKVSSQKKDLAEKQVKYRKASFQMIKYHFKPLGAMAKGKKPFDADKAKKNADAIATLSHFPINGFQTKSLTKDSTSLPKIWDNWADFEKEMVKFQETVMDLSNNTSSLEALKPAFAATAKTCKSCHKNYRKKKKK